MNRNQDDYVNINYNAFKKELPELMKASPGKFALYIKGEFKGAYHNFDDAEEAAFNFAKGKNFLVQEIKDTPIDLGYYSRASFLA